MSDKYGDSVHGMGKPGAAFAVALANKLPRGTVTFDPVIYPAIGLLGNWRKIINAVGAGTKIGFLGAYNGSVNDGKRSLRQVIEDEAKLCAKVKLVLVGYSQGAQAVADVYQRDLSPSQRSRIAGVVIFGDPYFNPADSTPDVGSYDPNRHGALGKRAPYPSSDTPIFSICHLDDPICQGPGRDNFAQHTNYQTDPWIKIAAAKIAAEAIGHAGVGPQMMKPHYGLVLLRALRVYRGPVLLPRLIPRAWHVSSASLNALMYEGEGPGTPPAPEPPTRSNYTVSFVVPAPQTEHSVHADGGSIMGTTTHYPPSCSPGATCPVFRVNGMAVDRSVGSGGAFYSWQQCGGLSYTIQAGSASVAAVKATIASTQPLAGTGHCPSGAGTSSAASGTGTAGSQAGRHVCGMLNSFPFLAYNLSCVRAHAYLRSLPAGWGGANQDTPLGSGHKNGTVMLFPLADEDTVLAAARDGHFGQPVLAELHGAQAVWAAMPYGE